MVFYHKTLGLRLLSEDQFAMAFDANGTMLRVQKVDQLRPAQYTVLGWEVPDLTRTADQLTAKGVTCERFPGMAQDDRGIWDAPSGARVAWFKDPDGNMLSLTEFG